jgi:hypothetical protein
MVSKKLFIGDQSGLVYVGYGPLFLHGYMLTTLNGIESFAIQYSCKNMVFVWYNKFWVSKFFFSKHIQWYI